MGPKQAERRTGHPAAGSRPVVLLIDDELRSDDPLILLMLEEFAVECVQSGAEGLHLSLTGVYDAIVLDLRLPDIPGTSVLEGIRALDSDTPVIVITGYHFDEDHERTARALGIHAYLRKPLIDDSLLSGVRAAIAGTQALPDRAAEHEPEAACEPPETPPLTQCFEMDAIQETADGRYPAGSNQLVSNHLLKLRGPLQRAFPRAPAEVVTGALEDALLEYLDGTLLGESLADGLLSQRLYQAAWRNMANALQAEKRRRVREGLYARGTSESIKPPGVRFARESIDRRARLAALVSTEAESRALFLYLKGAPLDAVVAALGCSALPTSEQHAEIKRFKDRILRRAQRIRPQSGRT